MLTLNVSANRHLREGDRVKVTRGDRVGCYAQVVGFDLVETEEPLVIQYGVSAGGGRENVGPNDVEYTGNFGEAPDTLEPLPEIRTVLTEGVVSNAYQTCGRVLCMKLLEDEVTISFVPKDNSVCLEAVLGAKATDMAEAVEEMLKVAFVTRRPHLVEIGKSKQIWQLLGAVSPTDAIGQLIAS